MARRARRERSIELTWPGKDELALDLDGVGWDDLELVETVTTSAEGEPSNLLVAGDNLVAMQALAERAAGTVDLVYIDPPYATGLSYYAQTEVGERRVYRDQRVGGMVGYLEAMYLRLSAIHRLLGEDGKLFLHCDWRASSHLRLLLDEIFGAECYRNEIIWRRAPNLGRQAASKQLGRVYDSIHVYSKSPGAEFSGVVPKRRAEVPLDRKGKPKGARWDEDKGLYFTTAPRGDYTDASIVKLRAEGRVFESQSGTIYIKYFLTRGDDGRWYKEQPVDALWDDFEVRPLRHRPKSEDMRYDTQKPEGLLERILGWATKPGDLVADFFCGSGTTAAVAEAMGRRWIACDAGPTAIDVTRRRILALGARGVSVRPFEIRSVARAERRSWARRQTDGDARAVLRAYGADPVDGRDGKRGDEHVTVAPIEGPPSARALDEACARARAAGSGALTVLAWEWDGTDPAALRKRAAAEHGLVLTLRTVPMDLARQVPEARLRFAERAEIDVEIVPHDTARALSVRLTAVRCPDPPRLRAETSPPAPRPWRELVEAWMVDFSGGMPWWSGRDGELAIESPPHPLAVGATRVRVRVITVYGDEIERSLRVEHA